MQTMHNNFSVVLDIAKVDELVFNVGKITYTAYRCHNPEVRGKYYNATNSNNTKFRSILRGEDEDYYYVQLEKGSGVTKNDVSFIVSKKDMKVQSTMKWHEMKERYFTESKADAIARKQAEIDKLQAEIDRLKAEIDSMK